MRKYIFQIFVGIIFPLSVYSQAQISNVKFSLNEQSKTIEIDYDIDYNSPEDSVYIGVIGEKSSKIKCLTLSGDIGKGVKSGSNKHIYWNIVADSIMINEEIAITVFVKLHDSRFRINSSTVNTANTKALEAQKSPRGNVELPPQSKAKNTLEPKESIIKAKVLITSGGIVTGLTMVIVGNKFKLRANQYYDYYKKNNYNQTLVVSNDDWLKDYSKLTIESANRDLALARGQQKTANLFFYGGITLTVLDLVYTISTLRKGYNRFSLQPIIGNNGSLAVNLNFKF